MEEKEKKRAKERKVKSEGEFLIITKKRIKGKYI
jgi:hypothetical protein